MSFPDEPTVYRSGYVPSATSSTPAYPINSPASPGGFPPGYFQPTQPPIQPPRRRKPLGGLAWFGILAAVGVILLGGIFGVAAFMGQGPGADLVKDRGVRACEAISAVKAGKQLDVSGLGSGKDGIAVLRDAFNHSRYSDLKTAGTEAMDLMRQFAGANGDQATGLAIVAGGQMVQKWSALSGACSAHGVDIPSLADMGK